MTFCHPSWRKIRPIVHCGVYVRERVGNGQTEGARVAATRGRDRHPSRGRQQALRRNDGGRRPDAVDPARQLLRACSGPSGCGKTTTLRMIGGFEDPTEGRVFLGGNDVTQHPPYKRDVNTVFQSYALFPHLSVEKNVAFGLERKKVDKAEVTQARRRGAGARPARPPGQAQAAQLSGGQAAARRARPRARQPPPRAAARRAARRARPAPAQAAADRAQAHPAGRRHHVRARDPRSGRGHEHGRHDRGDERRQDRAGGLGRRPLRAPADRVRGQLPRRLEPDRRARSRATAERRHPRRRPAARARRARG